MPAMTHYGYSLASRPLSLNNRPRAAFDTAVLTSLSYCTLSTVICKTVLGWRGCKYRELSLRCKKQCVRAVLNATPPPLTCKHGPCFGFTMTSWHKATRLRLSCLGLVTGSMSSPGVLKHKHQTHPSGVYTLEMLTDFKCL